MNMYKHIPNTITCLSLLSGCVACVAAFEGNLYWAAVWVIVAAAFDFLDGFAARLLKAYSPMGKELDSLSDLISFGMAPGLIVFNLLSKTVSSLPLGIFNPLVPYCAFVITVFSALRLAKFNIDDRQTTSFIGLPVPAHALFWAAIAFEINPVFHLYTGWFTLTTIVVAFLSSFLLTSKIPMFSLKVKSLTWKGNELRYVLVGCTTAFIVLWGFLGIAASILLYIILSIFNRGNHFAN